MACVSVVVPVYNSEKHIEHCVKSVLMQELKDSELILVDDGSNDRSGILCDSFCEADSRVISIHQKNSGVSAARNNGILLSKGEFLSFVDSDDWVEHSALFKMYNACKNEKAQMALCDYYIAEKDYTEEKQCGVSPIMSFSRKEAIQFYAELSLTKDNALFRAPWSKIIRRDIVLRHLFPVNRKYAEDAACVYLWIWDAERIIHVNHGGYYYFQNSEGICHSPIDDSFIGTFQTEEEQISFFEKNNFTTLQKMMCKRYIVDACSAYRKTKNKTFLKYLRTGIRKYGKTAGISPKTDVYYYETAYPMEMKYYWYLQSIKQKMKRKK